MDKANKLILVGLMEDGERLQNKARHRKPTLKQTINDLSDTHTQDVYTLQQDIYIYIALQNRMLLRLVKNRIKCVQERKKKRCEKG